MTSGPSSHLRVISFHFQFVLQNDSPMGSLWQPRGYFNIARAQQDIYIWNAINVEWQFSSLPPIISVAKIVEELLLPHGLTRESTASDCPGSDVKEAKLWGETKSFIKVTGIAGKSDEMLGMQAFGKD